MSTASIERVNELHKAGEYNDAAKMCLELIKAGEEPKEANILFARSFLFMLLPEGLKDHQSGFLNPVGASVRYCTTPEEVFEVEKRFMDIIDKWQEKTTKKLLAAFAVSPTADRWQGYINTWVKYPELSIYVTMTILGEQVVKDMAEAEGLTTGEFAKKYRPSREKLFDDKERRALEFDYAQQGFRRAVNYYNNNCDNHVGDAAVAAGKQTIMSLAMLDLAFSNSLKKPEEETQAEVLLRLKARAALKQFEMTATVGLEGKKTDLYTNAETRAKMIGELNGIHAQIRELDPGYVAPANPPVTPMIANSGGCYVATCVYGSYDCPQVWTLRRFRDNTLAATWYGRLFIKAYYAVSPTVVKWFGSCGWFHKLFKAPLDRMVDRLTGKGVENTPYEDR